MPNTEIPNEEKLEAYNAFYGKHEALCSIAISLKRIADLLEKEDQRKAEAKADRRGRGERMVKLGT